MTVAQPLLFEIRKQANIQNAQRRARRLWPTSKGFQGAYLKGWRARQAGLPADACPYDRHLYGGTGNGSWAWAWRNAWIQGHEEGT